MILDVVKQFLELIRYLTHFRWRELNQFCFLWYWHWSEVSKQNKEGEAVSETASCFQHFYSFSVFSFSLFWFSAIAQMVRENSDLLLLFLGAFSLNLFIALLWFIKRFLLQDNAFFINTGCVCNNLQLSVLCNNSSLDTFPITLNPHITSLAMHNTRVTFISDGLQFYEALHNLDLSDNTIKTIQDRAFSHQVYIEFISLI